jgi:hypothetical protein
MTPYPDVGPGDVLLVVDVQNDFCRGGKLAVPAGHSPPRLMSGGSPVPGSSRKIRFPFFVRQKRSGTRANLCRAQMFLQLSFLVLGRPFAQYSEHAGDDVGAATRMPEVIYPN